MNDYCETMLFNNFLEQQTTNTNDIFRNKRSQAKGVYYVFLYKQQLDSVYTRVAIHRFTLVPIVGHNFR